MNISSPESRATAPAPAPRSDATPVAELPHIGDRWPRLPFASLFVDFLTAALAIKTTTVIMRFMPWTPATEVRFNTLLPAVLAVCTLAAVGVYRMPGTGPCDRLRLRAVSGTLFAAYGLMVTVPAIGWLAALLFAGLTGGLLFVGGYYGQELLRTALGQLGHNGVPAAVIGTSEEARMIAAALLAHPEVGIRPVGFIALPDQPAVGLELPLPLLCRLEHATLIQPRLDLAVVTGPWRDRAEVEAALGPLPFDQFALIKDMKTVHTLRLRPQVSLADPKAARTRTGGPSTRFEHAVKRSIDVALTLPAVLLTLPIILVLVALVRLADPGRAIFVQQRIGYGGRSFNVYKIRTMFQDAEQRLETALAADPALAAEWRSNFKLVNDPRILPGVGHLLRRLSLDELPQLWNVLKGEMSLVGPRPFPPYHLKCFDTEFQAIRSTVMPGLTGLWQITSRSDGDLSVQREQDLLYIDNWSFWLDLQILLQTLPAVIKAKGAR